MTSFYRTHLRSFPDQLSPKCITVHTVRHRPRSAPDAVVVAGMGGSGIAGDLLAHFRASLRLPVPVITWKDFGLPELPFARPLVIAVSYSGDTRETLAAFRRAVVCGYARGAVTVGGALGLRARRERIPCATFTPPVGLTPREGVGYTYFALVELLRLWFPSIRNHDLSHTLRTAPLERAATRVAEVIGTRSMLIFAPTSYAPIGYLWKTVINETGKRPADFAVLPEACHNGIVEFSKHPKRSVAIFLDDPLESGDRSLATRAFRGIVARQGTPTVTVSFTGKTLEERTWNGILLGHFTALSLAEASGDDPTATPLIAELKGRLRKRGR